MDEQTLTLSDLLAEAAAAAATGDRAEAERLYRRATERSPGNTAAWLGLAAATNSTEEKRSYFSRVLAINPNHVEARAALQRLAQQAPSDQAEAIRTTLTQAAEAVKADPERYATETNAAVVTAGNRAPAPDQPLTCTNHPAVQTALRCNRCERPMCTDCVRLTDVGYRCKDCIREQQNVYFTAEGRDYVVAAVLSFVLAAAATPVIQLLLGIAGILFGILLALALGPVVGGAAVTLIRRSVGRRRGRYLGVVVVVSILLGMTLGMVVAAVFHLGMSLMLLAVFAFTALSTVYATLR
ncbi:MAG: tetratricopeptide repeat protein [Caldilineales bacterium]